jgi:hypothetical protein
MSPRSGEPLHPGRKMLPLKPQQLLSQTADGSAISENVVRSRYSGNWRKTRANKKVFKKRCYSAEEHTQPCHYPCYNYIHDTSKCKDVACRPANVQVRAGHARMSFCLHELTPHESTIHTGSNLRATKQSSKRSYYNKWTSHLHTEVMQHLAASFGPQQSIFAVLTTNKPSCNLTKCMYLCRSA